MSNARLRKLMSMPVRIPEPLLSRNWKTCRMRLCQSSTARCLVLLSRYSCTFGTSRRTCATLARRISLTSRVDRPPNRTRRMSRDALPATAASDFTSSLPMKVSPTMLSVANVSVQKRPEQGYPLTDKQKIPCSMRKRTSTTVLMAASVWSSAFWAVCPMAMAASGPKSAYAVRRRKKREKASVRTTRRTKTLNPCGATFPSVPPRRSTSWKAQKRLRINVHRSRTRSLFFCLDQSTSASSMLCRREADNISVIECTLCFLYICNASVHSL
mmetsp:Transcript_31793/g.87513  ORF Transcript_31793/g.87513 Transcript_31793/m.87513 type:complete len:271 (+) Transcript_31793:2131-2943(+)